MNRIKGLDTLRGIAAISVVLFHFTSRYQTNYGHPSIPLFSFPQGFRGVDLFFIVSGFVIFMTLDNTRHSLDFVVSRFSRLFPAYWVSMIATFVVVLIFGLPGKEVSIRDFLLNFTMLPDLLHAQAVDGAYWTLEIELFFYTLMLLLFRAQLIGYIHYILMAWLCMRLMTYAMSNSGIHVSYLFSHLLILPYIALFGTGMMLYRLHRDTINRTKAYAVLAACLSVIAVTEPAEGIVVPVLASITILMLSHGKLIFFSNRILVFFGTISYPLYLLHENIGFVIMRSLYSVGISPAAVVAITFSVMIACATAVNVLIEQPAQRWIRKVWAVRHVRLSPSK